MLERNRKAYHNAAEANALWGAHIYKTGPKDNTAIGSFDKATVAIRPCTSVKG